jgi:hypothetical protein
LPEHFGVAAANQYSVEARVIEPRFAPLFTPEEIAGRISTCTT